MESTVLRLRDAVHRVVAGHPCTWRHPLAGAVEIAGEAAMTEAADGIIVVATTEVDVTEEEADDGNVVVAEADTAAIEVVMVIDEAEEDTAAIEVAMEIDAAAVEEITIEVVPVEEETGVDDKAHLSFCNTCTTREKRLHCLLTDRFTFELAVPFYY